MGYLLDNCKFYKLSPEKINKCKSFKCSKEPDIDSFFHNNTRDNFYDYSSEMMGSSHCFCTDSETPEMVCAFSLSNSALRTAPLPTTIRNKFNKKIPNNKRRTQYPAILIGRLCVFDAFAHMKIGDEMMDLIKNMALDANVSSAVRYLVVDAVNKPNVLNFYQNNGFNFLFSSDQEELECLHANKLDDPDYKCLTRLMYFDLIVLKR